MLYDPKWETPTLDGFVNFLASKPAEETYYAMDGGNCAIAQYLASLGTEYNILEGKFDHWELNITLSRPCTFGAALERARALLNAKEQQ